MLILFLFLMFTLLSTNVQSYNCSNIFTFQHSNCDFYFNNTNNCNNFQFQYCKWQRCLHWKRRDNTDYCENYEINNSTDWQLCTSSCCHSNLTYARNWDSVYECQASINQSYYGTTALSGVMLGLVILMVVFASCCFCYCCRTGCLGCCCEAIRDCLVSLLQCQCLRMGGDVRRLDHNVSQDGIAGQNQPNQTVYNNSHEWKYASPTEIKQGIENVICCVCLQDRTGLQLQCGHLLHKECLRECLRSKMQCPLCRSNRINRVRIYCGKCFRAYMYGTLVSLFENKLSLGGVCNRCKQMNDGNSKQ